MIRHAVFDVETNGLLNGRDGKAVATKIHCICIKDFKTGERYTFDPMQGSLDTAISILENADRVYAHNGIRFDVPILQKLAGMKTPKAVTDSLVAGRVVYAHVKELDWPLVQVGRMPARYAGKDSLEAWGFRLGLRKGTYDLGWEEWTPEMTEYCELDVDVTEIILRKIQKQGFSKQALDMEMELAEYIFLQEEFGVGFRVEAAQEYQAELSARRQEVAMELVEMFGSWAVPGKILTPKRDNARYGYVEGCPLQHFKYVQFNPGSRDHIAFRLKVKYGWEPPNLTDSGKPQIDEDALKGCTFPEAAPLREYLLLDKLLGQIAEGKNAWFKYLTEEGRIHGGVNTNGTRTHRASHMHPNLGQVPSKDSKNKALRPYGERCRSLFYPGRKGMVQVGSDAKGLELRMLAHHMARWDDGAFAKVVVEGDPHGEVFAPAWGLDRPRSKTKTYAYLYGCGNGKLGEGNPRKGKALRTKMERMIPALGFLQNWVQEETRKKKFLKAIDGRLIRSPSEHSALNTQLQCDGSLVVKYWIIRCKRRFYEMFGPPSLDTWFPMLWVHDEQQLAATPDIADRMTPVFDEEMQAVAEMFNLRCPMGADAQVGESWAETH